MVGGGMAKSYEEWMAKNYPQMQLDSVTLHDYGLAYDEWGQIVPIDFNALAGFLRRLVGRCAEHGTDVRWPRLCLYCTAYGSLPDPPAHAQTLDELRLERGNRVQELLDSEASSTLALLYKALYARGMRVGGVDQDIEKALRKELGKD